MNKDNVISFENRELFEDPLTDLIRNGARQLITLGVEAELDEFMASMMASIPKAVIGRSFEAVTIGNARFRRALVR